MELKIYGFPPGPLLIKESPDMFWGLVGSMYLGSCMLLVLNLPLIGLWVKVLKIPSDILFSLIVLFCIIGAYTVNNNISDIYIMLIFGAFGYLMKKFKYEAPPLVLALVLGPMFENALRRPLIIGQGSVLIFFKRPISATLLGVALLILISAIVTGKRLGQAAIQKGGDDD